MTALAWTSLFVAALVVSSATRAWLAFRQVRHVGRHRDAVPAAFAATVPIARHRLAADYTLAKSRWALLQLATGALITVGWTLFGGLDALNVVVRDAVLPFAGPLGYEVALVAAFAVVAGILSLPFSLWSTFVIEERFGFNRTTWRLFVTDAVKGLALAIVVGLPLVALVLWIMQATGALWWLWAWAAWLAVAVGAQVVVPTVIAPLFNRFERLSDETLAARVQALMQRAGFAAKGLFVMDGSRRSAHANAYFTGFGKAKRVVFFDTLLAKLRADEVEAVLAHELGHFKLRHRRKRLVVVAVAALAFFAILGFLLTRTWFYAGLGVQPNATAPNDALALLLLLEVGPLFTFFVTPLASTWSRRDEYQADAYACSQASGRDLASALVKLHEDNATTLTPDPVYARFYYSHPPPVDRLAALLAAPSSPA